MQECSKTCESLFSSKRKRQLFRWNVKYVMFVVIVVFFPQHTNALTEFASALMCNTGKNRLQLKLLPVLQAKNRLFAFFLSHVTTREQRVEEKKECVWELVNRSDFFHRNHTLNLFPLSDRVSLSFSHTHRLQLLAKCFSHRFGIVCVVKE